MSGQVRVEKMSMPKLFVALEHCMRLSSTLPRITVRAHGVYLRQQTQDHAGGQTQGMHTGYSSKQELVKFINQLLVYTI
jgi:hypothetical protein